MRILSIRFSNLNSLAGEWEIDFTDPAYTSDGIFAITGPTGAGKTTLLDAVCLALYRQTPRLGDITATSNEIMTRQTGECFAEVTFSTQNGSFRAHWSQHRARKQASGKLQAARHEIHNVDTGKIIDSKFGTVDKRIIEITGMDFGRFTQSMLLAQGGFAAFLRAGADARAPILEKITGTAIYSAISISVHERRSQEDQTLNLLTAEQEGMRLLSPEVEAELRTEASALTDQLTDETRKADTLRVQHQWQQRCQQLEQQQLRLTADLESWQTQDKTFDKQRQRLADAIRALELNASYTSLTALRTDQQQEQQNLIQDETRLPELAGLLKDKQGQVEQLEDVLENNKKRLNTARPVLKKVHVLDSRLADGKQRLQTLQASLDERLIALHRQDAKLDLQDFADQEQARQYHRAAVNAAEQAQQALDRITQDNRPAQWREQGDALSERISRVDSLLQKISERSRQLQQREQLATDTQHKQDDLDQCAGTLALAEEVSKAHQTTLKSLQDQQILQQRVINMETMRAELEHGESCPLCGATEHPYAEHAPRTDLSRLSQLLEAQEQLLGASEKSRHAAHTRYVQLSTTISTLEAQARQIGLTLETLTKTIRDSCQQLEIDDNAETLAQYQQTLLKRRQQISRTLQDIDDLEATLKTAQRQRDLAKTIQDTVAIRVDLEEHRHQLDTLHTERHDLLKDTDPDQEEARLQTLVNQAQHALATAQQQLQKTRSQQQQLQHQIDARIRSVRLRAHKLEQAEQDFTTALQDQNFETETAFISALLPEPERKALQTDMQTWQQQGIELRGALARNRKELDEELNRALTSGSLDELQTQSETQEAVVSNLREKLGALRQRLKDNDDIRQQQQSLTARIDQQKIEVERWRRLHALIGSNDGKKFRNFAQGLTFELMIRHANVQLQKMTDRYLLQRDQEQPLDLNVIDNYQAGEVRSTKNLSGGESFIVSLALALGLSRMASHNVRVDSLFLDEGFGTLDEDALDTALETLGSLQQEGKLIGVISHVTALKERIATQITVYPLAGGRSTLSGPGCRAIT